MDLNKTLQNFSLWEVKSFVRKAQNSVWKLSEIEIKVREATNNEPWGPSNSLMAEIAKNTYTYKDIERISSMIFKRFTDKSASEWRQIYKSLVLLDYLVKNGNQRFVDHARKNISLVSMLRSFRYVDSKEVDQGINIRTRAKELTILLNDEAKIKAARRKAREYANKFDGISSTSVRTNGYAFKEYKGKPESPIAKDLIISQSNVTTFTGDLLGDDFDDFDEFQSAPLASSTTTTATPQRNFT